MQNVNTDQTLIERMLGVGTVDFDTAGSDDSDFASSRSGASPIPAAVAKTVDAARQAVAAGSELSPAAAAQRGGLVGAAPT